MSRFEELVKRAAAKKDAAEISRSECLEAAREFSRTQREYIRERHEQGESGGDVVRMLTETADTLIQGIFRFGVASLDIPRVVLSRICLCALGGYGRGELNPCSDLDVCLLYDGKLDGPIEHLNDFLVPFLWDMGFVVGYSIRSVKETTQLAADDVQELTSLLEGRFLCGESTVFARMKLSVRELRTGSWTGSFIEQKIKARFDDLPSEQADLFAPQPNVKESAGGLRDFHTTLWLLMAGYSVDNLEDAVAQGLITSEEHLEFTGAVDFLWRVRNEMHFANGSAEDRLTFDNQKRIAKSFGYASAHQSSVLQFMQDYYAHASRIRQFLRTTVKLCNYTVPAELPVEDGEEAPNYVIQDGHLFVGLHDKNWFAHNPSRIMEVLWRCARHDVQLSRHSERLLKQNLSLINEAFQSSDLVRRFFVAACNRPYQAGRALRQASDTGVLAAYLPEWDAIQGVLRYEDFHHYPVDEHTLLAIESLSGLEDMEGAVGRCLREALENLTDPYILVMAILCHDLGKAAGEVHVAESVACTRRICQRIGMPEEDEERIVFLVEQHMLMNNISQYRDTDDEHIVQNFVDTVKTEQRLRALFILSFADLYAVGPNVWNEWKGALLLQLYLKAVKRLLGRAETVGEEFWNSPKAKDMEKAAPPSLRKEVKQHLKAMGQRYFVAFSPHQAANHLACIQEASEEGLAVYCETLEGSRQSELIISTQDRPGLFSKLAGAFASQLIDVNSAALFTRPDGYVVDCFTVSDARQKRPLTRAQVKSLERVLREILLEDKSVQEHVEKSRRRLFALLQPRIPVPTRIEFDNDSARDHTVIDIEAGDRTGLLYDITRAMAEADLDISTARIVTDARRVRDSFYVQREGRKVKDELEQEEIRKGLHNAIHPRSTAEAKEVRYETS